jgi:ribosomal subunit interface protein
MNIQIKYTQFQSSPDIEKYAKDKISSLGKFLKRHEKESEITVFVELGRTTRRHRHGQIFFAEITIELKGEVIRTEHTDANIRIAVTRAKERMQEELQKYKGKHSWKSRINRLKVWR